MHITRSSILGFYNKQTNTPDFFCIRLYVSYRERGVATLHQATRFILVALSMNFLRRHVCSQITPPIYLGSSV